MIYGHVSEVEVDHPFHFDDATVVALVFNEGVEDERPFLGGEVQVEVLDLDRVVGGLWKKTTFDERALRECD